MNMPLSGSDMIISFYKTEGTELLTLLGAVDAG